MRGPASRADELVLPCKLLRAVVKTGERNVLILYFQIEETEWRLLDWLLVTDHLNDLTS